jgi:large subunit ribosomal protein L17
MRHRKAGNPLGRNTGHRRALLRNMVTSLFKHEQIETTDAKAKAIRPVAEKMITLAKRGDLHARRQVLAYLQEKAVTHRLFEEIKERYLDRQGGYVRILKKGVRKGDGAAMSIVQLLPPEETTKPPKQKPRKSKAAEAEVRKAKKPKATEKKPARKRTTRADEGADTQKASRAADKLSADSESENREA